jgi:hypothetical protein
MPTPKDYKKNIEDNIKKFSNEKSFRSLKTEILEAITNYRQYNKKNRSFFSFFSKHGDPGLKRADNLEKEVAGCKNIYELAKAIGKMEGGNYRQHSLKTYIAKVLFNTFRSRKDDGATFSDNNDEDIGIKLPNNDKKNNSQGVEKIDIKVKEFLSYVIEKIKEKSFENAVIDSPKN